MNELPQIGISYEDTIPKDIVDNITSTISHEKLNLVVESREESGPRASLEWLIPTAIGIFITKSYFSSFLSEMGKDHYLLLKNGLKSVWGKIFSIDREIKIRQIGTEGKISGDFKYSHLFSIWAVIDEKHRFKFLFEDTLTEEEYFQRLELILKFLEDFYGKREELNEYITSMEGTNMWGTILVAFDDDSKKLKIIDPIGDKKT
jgi:hypothetical protein